MTWAIERVVESRDLLGESPVWDDRDDSLWWVDILGRRLHRLLPGQGEHTRWPLPAQVGAIGLRESGGLVVATREGFGRYVPGDAGIAMIAAPLAGTPDVRFNDGRCDRRGRFWSGTVQEKRVVGGAQLFRLDREGRCERMIDGLTVTNALAWSPDGRTMYYADSHPREIYACEFDEDAGLIGRRRLFAKWADDWGQPDGATVDVDGCLWIAAIHGGAVLRCTPDGRVDRRIPMPALQPTSCTFGGAGMATLFVTSARRDHDDAMLARTPLAGDVFALNVGVAGLPEPRCAA